MAAFSAKKEGSSEYRYRSRAIEVITRTLSLSSKPSILELGSARETTLEFFGSNVSSLFIADLRDLILSSLDQEGAISRVDSCLAALPNTGAFDLILAWDLLNYLDSKELAVFLPKLASLCKPGSLLLVLLSDRPVTPLGPLQCRIQEVDEIVLEASTRTVEMPCHCTHALLKKHFADLGVESSVRLRNGICEILFVTALEQRQENPLPRRALKRR